MAASADRLLDRAGDLRGTHGAERARLLERPFGDAGHPAVYSAYGLVPLVVTAFTLAMELAPKLVMTSPGSTEHDHASDRAGPRSARRR